MSAERVKLTMDQFHALELWVLAAQMPAFRNYDLRRREAFEALVDPAERGLSGFPEVRDPLPPAGDRP